MKQAFLLSLLLPFALPSFSQNNIQLLSHLPYSGGVECSNLTGYADSNGHEYALVGNTQGLSIVDITNPATPTQLFLVAGATGQNGLWREVREYKGYAYVTTEQNSGLQVVDLHYLPDSVPNHIINPGGMHTSHTIFIDENGIAYVNGTDKGQLFLDLNANAWNPPLLGKFTNNYVHDCYVRHDTMWAALINDGFIKVVDVRNKATADVPANTLASWSTPLNFSHNCWLSDDSKYLFTTDEKPNSTLTCYDVSDLNNVTETDRTQVNPGSNTIIHNTYFMNNYCITSYYTYGIAIYDVTRKNNLVEVGNFDTSPNYSGDGFNGAWGVWPFLPSGNIIVSDIETGLWVLGPTYKRACYLEGLLTDSICNSILNGVQIDIVEDTVSSHSNYLGKYSMGTPDSGTYTIRYSKNGYQTKEIYHVHLQNGVLTTLNVELLPISTSKLVLKTVDAATGNDLPFVQVLIQDTAGNTYQEIATQANGEYSFCDFVQGNYSFYAGKWGRVTTSVSKNINTLADTLIISVAKGYYDDFLMDYGWTVTSTASTGDWERGEPIGTFYGNTPANPGADVSNDFGTSCFVTGNNGGQAGDDDIDDGSTTLRSPLFDLSTYTDPYLSYYRWFFNDGGQGSSFNDSLLVMLSNGVDSVLIDTVGANNFQQSQWIYRNIRVKDYLTLTQNMRITFYAADNNPGHLVEAALDLFQVTDSGAIETSGKSLNENVAELKAFPNPFTHQLNIRVEGLASPTAQLIVLNTLGQTVYQTEVTKNHTLLNIGEELSNGVYFIRLLENGKETNTLRVIKQE